MLEARQFILTDHKPIIYAFQKKRDKCSLWQFNHLAFVAQFTSERLNTGQDIFLADALSRVEFVTAPPSYDALVASQDNYDKLQTLMEATTVLPLEKLPISGTTLSIYCDISAVRSISSTAPSVPVRP
jgi:hypothetical protein